MPEISTQQAPADTGLQIDASVTSKLNLADFQNAIPTVCELAIQNDSDLPCRGLVVSVSSDPAFFRMKQWRIDDIGPRQTCRIPNPDLQIDGPLLARLTEAESARVRFEIRLAGDTAEPVSVLEKDVELLPRNHWGGLSHLPEMVAAFVQPNDPAVDRLLKKTAQILRDTGRNAALNGYEDGPKHAWEILSAIWTALASEKLDYALPAASFEQCGQKVRGPSQLMQSGLGTCLDLSVLVAAAAEQAGLNPVLVFTRGHVFTGCWMRPEEFALTVIDDAAALRKRLLLKHLVFFESTVITAQPAPPFSRAVELGAKQIAENASAPFEAAIDIRRARMHKIRPLANAEAPLPGHTSVETDQPATVVIEEAPDFPEDLVGIEAESDPKALTPADRISRWQRKLLDLSLRNSLLNFRKNKRAVTIETPDPEELHRVLGAGQATQILPFPDLMDGSDPRSRAIHEGRSHEDIRKAYAIEGLTKRQIFSALSADELEATLVELYRSARTSLEEGGANTLFLAAGFLVWTQEGKEQRYRAPLMLIPVTLNRRSVRSGFTLSIHEEEPQFNPTLVEMLHQDFQLNLGIGEFDLRQDDSGVSVTAIQARVSEAIKDIKGWEVVADVVLSTFSFARYLMWKDLVHRTDQLRNNAVVKHLIDSPRDAYQSDIRFVSPAVLDREYRPHEMFCPLPADSSQLAAIMSAVRGKDFVLIGPPGTGKSQTIANLIAHSIACGKRVLFVAEKIAALEVVYRRLREVGLGQFCLELHSSKAKKTSVLSALGAAWAASGEANAGAWEQQAERLQKLRDSLNVYVERIHRPYANGMTVHQALGIVIANEGAPVVDLSWPEASQHSRESLDALRNAINKLALHATDFGVEDLIRTPLSTVKRLDWTPLWQTEFLRTVGETKAGVNQCRKSFAQLEEVTGLPEILDKLLRPGRTALAELACSLAVCAGKQWKFATRQEASVVVADLRRAAALVATHRSITAELGEPWTDNAIAAATRCVELLKEREALRAALPEPWPGEIVSRLREGIDILHQIHAGKRDLRGRYDLAAADLDVIALEQGWQAAEASFWPKSWFAKRHIATILARAGGADRENAARDLPILRRLEKLQRDANEIDLRALPGEVWSGLNTSIDAAEAAIRLQEGIAQVRGGAQWEPVDPGLVASGLCGAILKQTLGAIQRLSQINKELAKFDWLSGSAEGVWNGSATKPEVLAAAISFYEQWRGGALRDPHVAVARGDCGASLQYKHGLLAQRANIESQVAGFVSLAERTEGLWRGLESDLNEIRNAIEFGEIVNRTLPAIAQNADELFQIQAAIARVCSRPGDSERIIAAGRNFRSAVEALERNIATMAEAGQFEPDIAEDFRSDSLYEIERQCVAILNMAPRLQRWCAWLRACDSAKSLGLLRVTALLETGSVSPSELGDIFETNYSRWWLDHVVSEDEVLRSFISSEHEQRIADFRATDDRYTALTRDIIRARVRSATPSAETVPQTSEWGVLRRELAKKTKHIALRELMERIPSVVTALTPCLLMSPLSVAQYLPPSESTFDIIIFDEASQITVWDAIGAIARAKQVVMVGDPKQLPPTNFFNKTELEEDTGDLPEDLESILDECIGANLPKIQLNWHYRSRHESLITFSNHRYYGGELVTFPSPATKDSAVSFHHVRGTYEKGGARTNQIEAKAVVGDIVARLKSRDFARSDLSIGVVTLNAEQQKLIEDLLDLERHKDPALEHYFSDSVLEKLFVKNLESVQGDQRDIMYFSLTYGPDIAGKVSVNFGPMNRDGGERRLNVAITRAKRELRVFSSLRSEQIDLSRTRSRGVLDLKQFLDFAERGPRAFAEAVTGSKGDFDSLFEQYVADALQSRGWIVHKQIGASAFRIDLGVVHPDAPGIHLAGIECDGATYHRSATARDRDKLREQVLRGLGWQIVRVWSTDWWIDRATTLDKVDGELRRILDESRSSRRADTRDQNGSESEISREGDKPEIDLPLLVGVPNASSGTYRERHTLEEDVVRQRTASAQPHFEPERFFEKSYDPVLSCAIREVVETEGPVLADVLSRRIARLHGWHRTGPRITERVARLAARSFKRTREEGGVFFWPQNLDPGAPAPFRSELERSIDEICVQELMSLALDVISAGKTGEEAVIEMARAVGLQRLRESSRVRLDAALARACDASHR